MFLHTKLQKRASYGIPIEFSNVFGHFPAKKFDLSRIDKYRHICLQVEEAKKTNKTHLFIHLLINRLETKYTNLLG